MGESLRLDAYQVFGFVVFFLLGGNILLQVDRRKRGLAVEGIEKFLTGHFEWLLTMAVLAFLSLVIGVAYVTILVPSTTTFYNIASSLVTVEGLLLTLVALTSISAKRVLKELVVLATTSFLWSIVTIMFTQLQFQILPLAMSAIFLVDVGLFVLVVAVYSITVIRMRPDPTAHENKMSLQS